MLSTARDSSSPEQRLSEAGNRRLFHRYAVGLEATVHSSDAKFACKVMDLSLGGAGIQPGCPDLVGGNVRLHIEGIDLGDGLAAEVVRSDIDQCNLRFTLNEGEEIALVMHLMADPATRE